MNRMRVYVGPYLECTPKEETRIVSRKKCPNDHDGSYPSHLGDYCSTCGAARIDIQVQEGFRQVPSWGDVSDGVKQALAQEIVGRKHCWFSNYGKPKSLCDITRVDAVPVTPEIIAATTLEFETKHKADIEYVRSQYEGGGEIRWGILTIWD